MITLNMCQCMETLLITTIFAWNKLNKTNLLGLQNRANLEQLHYSNNAILECIIHRVIPRKRLAFYDLTNKKRLFVINNKSSQIKWRQMDRFKLLLFIW